MQPKVRLVGVQISSVDQNGRLKQPFSGQVTLCAQTDRIKFDFVHEFKTMPSVEEAVHDALSKMRRDLADLASDAGAQFVS